MQQDRDVTVLFGALAASEYSGVVQQLAGKRAPQLKSFKSTIPKRVALEDVVREHLVSGEEGIDPDVEKVYESLTTEALRRIANQEAAKGKHHG
ncbi:MAG: hypothetical protein GEV10_31505 [Streptosporangiales bacterium]|nr:hypothetical protein [Streptosporangiales bacterium]